MWANIFGIGNLCQITITIKKTCPTKYVTFRGIFYFMNKIPRNTLTNVKSFRNKTIIQAIAFGIDFICCVFTFGSNRICELSYIYVPFENIKTCRIYIFGVVIFHDNFKKKSDLNHAFRLLCLYYSHLIQSYWVFHFPEDSFFFQ